MALKTVIRKTKFKCNKCIRMGIWYLMGSGQDPAPVYCDLCVPRGCSCNWGYLEEGFEGPVDVDRDERGRELPCCDFIYDPLGWEDDEDSL